MTLAEYRDTITEPLRQCTLVFLQQGDQILLAMKKRGFGAGRWNGVGGKVEENETIRQAAVREAEEEIGVRIHPEDLRGVAVLNFYFSEAPADKDWNQQVYVYFCDDWQNEPVESEEMAPQWYHTYELPYPDMWPGDELWLSKVLEGHQVEAAFMFDASGNVANHELRVV